MRCKQTGLGHLGEPQEAEIVHVSVLESFKSEVVFLTSHLLSGQWPRLGLITVFWGRSQVIKVHLPFL
jgi:hypothetical protein